MESGKRPDSSGVAAPSSRGAGSPLLGTMGTSTAASADDLGREDTPSASLPNTGGAEYSMKVFIQEHMTSILEPLADHIQELHHELEGMLEDIRQLNGKADKSLEVLGDHDRRLLTLAASIARNSEDLNLTKAGLNDLGEALAVARNGDEEVQAALRRTEGQVQALASVGKELRKSMEELEGRNRQLQLQVSESSVLHLGFSDRLSEVKSMYEGLGQRHLDTIKHLQHVKQAEDDTQENLKRHIAASERQRKDDGRSFTLLDQRTKTLETMLIQTDHTQQKQARTIKRISDDMQQCTRAIEEATGGETTRAPTPQPVQSAQPRDLARSRTEMVGPRVAKLEESLTNLERAQATDRNTVLSSLTGLRELVEKNTADISRNTSNLESTTQAERMLERRVHKLEEWAQEVDKKQHDVQRQADKTDHDVRPLFGAVKELENKIDQLQIVDDLASRRQDGLEKELQATAEAMEQLEGELDATNSVVTKIGTRLELAHEYFQGLGKGFQDTHKKVCTGSDGMMPPRTTQRKILPDLPGGLAPTPSRPASVARPATARIASPGRLSP